MEVRSILIEPSARTTATHGDYSKHLEKLQQYGCKGERDEETDSIASQIHRGGETLQGSDEEEEPGETKPDALSQEEELDQESEGEGAERTSLDETTPLQSRLISEHIEDGTPTGESSYGFPEASLTHLNFIRDGTIDELAQSNRKLVAEKENLEARLEEEMGKKHKKKVKHEERSTSYGEKTRSVRHQPGREEDPGEHRPSLNPIPNPVQSRERPCGITAITWVGSPWAINGDVLIVTTDKNLRVHNTNFKELLSRKLVQVIRER